MPNVLSQVADRLAPALQVWAQRQHDRKIADALAQEFTPPAAGAPPPRGDPMAALAALGGKGPQPAPQAGPPQAGPPPVPFKPGAPVQPGQPDPLAPRPQGGPPAPPAPPPGAPTGQPGAEAPTGMSATIADPAKEAESILKNIFQSIKAANPKADNLTVLEAAERQIDLVKGIAPVTKATMQGQIQLLHLNEQRQMFDQRELRLANEHTAKLEELTQHHANQDEIAAENARFRGEMAAVAKERASYYAQDVEYRHEDREASTSARLQISDASNLNKMSIAELREQGLSDRAASALKGKNGAALAGAIAKIQSSGGTVDTNTLNTLIDALSSGGTSAGGAKGKGGGGEDIHAWAKQNGVTLIRQRKDGKWDAKDSSGKVGVVG